jgi:hypothetical protein
MQISGTRHSPIVSMDLTASPVSVYTESGPLAVAVCTGGVWAGSFCKESATAVSTIDSARSGPVVPAAVVTVLSIVVGCGASKDSVLVLTVSVLALRDAAR